MHPVVGLLVRATPVLVVLSATLVAFASGVELSERAGIADAPAVVQLYYAAGLFVLGGLDLGVPTGGPDWARSMLWASYFAGPAITTTAVAEGVLRMARPRWVVRLFNRDHTVVVGESRVAQVYTGIVRTRGDRLRQATVDELKDPVTRHTLALGRARAVVLVSANDLENLDLAWEVSRLHPDVPVACHVAQLGLRRSADELAQSAGVHVFNSHEAAAARLYQSTLAPHFAATEGKDGVGLIGFGRFGQTVLRHIEEHAADEVNRAVVVDRGARPLLRTFEEQVPCGSRVACEALDADIRDPEVWDRVAAALATHARPVLVLCTDDEAINLQAAIGLRQRVPDALIHVRHFRKSPFTDGLAERYALECMAIEHVLTGAIGEHYRLLRRR